MTDAAITRHRKQSTQQRNQDVTLSKSLSYVLRHAAPSLGLETSSDGYVPVDDVLSLNHPKFRDKQSGLQRYTVGDVIRVVEDNDKQRFRLEYKTVSDNDDDYDDTLQSISSERTVIKKRVLCIRANQGHSFNSGLQSNQLFTSLTSEDLSNDELIIVHGTTRRAWEDYIRVEGLRRMKRNHIHFATGLPSGQESTVISGMRSSSEIYIFVNGKKCADDAIPFYRSDNGVILTAGVDEEGLLPLTYFDRVVHASSGKVLWKNDL